MKTVIGFDMDGVIIDSDRPGDTWFHDSFARTLVDFGIEPTVDNIRCLYITSMRNNPNEVCEKLGVSDPELFWKRRDENYVSYKLAALDQGKIQLFPDVDALKQLKKKYPLAVVSNSPQAIVDRIIGYFSLDSLFRIWIGRGSTLLSLQSAKPAPKMLLEMMERLQAVEGYYVGDRPEDLGAARAAGLIPIKISRYDDDGDIHSLEELPLLLNSSS
jgi:phosphoglycolate phosphatase-like HAD superfamily hydrolase